MESKKEKRLLLTIRYDGTNYSGWQVQKNAITIQEKIQDAIEGITGFRSDVIGCSRTDSGVHADKFCLTFDTVSNIPPPLIIRALNTQLPEDIVGYDCRLVSNDFHPRYNAKSKEYHYLILNEKIRNPFLNKYSWQVYKELDREKMKKASAFFMGKHDFSAFCSTGTDVKDKVRNVYKSEIIEKDNMIVYKVSADGFLYNMVRILVGTLTEVGQGKISPGDVPIIIKEGIRENAGITAPSCGLFLKDVVY